MIDVEGGGGEGRVGGGGGRGRGCRIGEGEGRSDVRSFSSLIVKSSSDRETPIEVASDGDDDAAGPK